MPRQVLTEDEAERFLNSQNSVNSWVSPEWLQQLSKDLAVKRLCFSFIKWPRIHFRFINCIVLFSELFC